MLKKIAVLAAALAVSAPALADRGDRGHGYRYGHGQNQVRHVVVHKPVHVVHRPVHVVHRPVRVVHHYHRPAPRPVYVVERHDHLNPVAVLAGAVIGAAIVHHVVTGY
jgi:hypothetical protein